MESLIFPACTQWIAWHNPEGVCGHLSLGPELQLGVLEALWGSGVRGAILSARSLKWGVVAPRDEALFPPSPSLVSSLTLLAPSPPSLRRLSCVGRFWWVWLLSDSSFGFTKHLSAREGHDFVL